MGQNPPLTIRDKTQNKQNAQSLQKQPITITLPNKNKFNLTTIYQLQV